MAVELVAGLPRAGPTGGSTESSTEGGPATCGYEEDDPVGLATVEKMVEGLERCAVDFELEEFSGPVEIWRSKVGGQPYLPTSEAYPCGKCGPLNFLAQINFAEMPALDKYPSKGVLAFYFAGDDDLMGLDFHNPTSQSGSRVLYFPDAPGPNGCFKCGSTGAAGGSATGTAGTRGPAGTSGAETVDESCGWCNVKFQPAIVSTGLSPLRGAAHYVICFGASATKQPISTRDHRFAAATSATLNDEDLEEYEDAHPGSGHRVGGYPHFTQSDPRSSDRHVGYELLLQLDSDQHIMWGDAGVANFFITREQLEARDFSKVLFNWDCC